MPISLTTLTRLNLPNPAAAVMPAAAAIGSTSPRRRCRARPGRVVALDHLIGDLTASVGFRLVIAPDQVDRPAPTVLPSRFSPSLRRRAPPGRNCRSAARGWRRIRPCPAPARTRQPEALPRSPQRVTASSRGPPFPCATSSALRVRTLSAPPRPSPGAPPVPPPADAPLPVERVRRPPRRILRRTSAAPRTRGGAPRPGAARP